MATLYDLELQDSNNMIHLFIAEGTAASLKLLREQKEMAPMLGEAGEQIVKSLEDPTTDIGKSFARLNQLEQDFKKVIAQVEITGAHAQKANDIFSRNPDSLEDLTDEERSIIQDYWIKKKTAISELVKLGYTYQELFS